MRILPRSPRTVALVAARPRPRPWPWPWQSIGVLRLTGLAGSFVFGSWLLSSALTSAAGASAIAVSLLVALLYVFPISLLPLIGLSASKTMKYALLVVAISLATALIWANVA